MSSLQAEEPFPREFAFLPADSAIPWTRPWLVPAGSEAGSAARVILQQVVEIAEDVLQLIESHVVTMYELSDRLAPLSRATSTVYALFGPELQILRDQVEEQSSVGSGPAAASRDGWAALPEDIVIDVVFRVIRVPALTMGQFAAQVAATCRGVLADLPCVILGIDEMITLIRTIKMMFEGLVQHLTVAEADLHMLHRKPAHVMETDAPALEPHGLSLLWKGAAGDPHERTAQVAAYRWLLGVHLFNLATLYCRDGLIRARNAFEHSGESSGVQALRMASLFLRGTTAAMWYSGNFSADTYQRHIRPFIVRPGTSDGLSGSEMLDYKHMKAEKAQLRATLVARHGRNFEAWPPTVLAAVKEFRAAYIEDMEHHMRLAAARIGGDTSLAQKIWQAELPQDLTLKNAAEVLRDMAALRRQEFPF